MKPEGLDRLDYFCHQLAKNGVYYGWSHTYHFRPRPGNRDRLLAYDEIKNQEGGNTYALINFAEDVQDLMIEMVVNLLKHKNPYTGTTYAEDPALAYIELQNEDDIFFYTTGGVYERYPTYKKNFMERFANWLEEKYQDQAGLQAAWGDALKAGRDAGREEHRHPTESLVHRRRYLPDQQGGSGAACWITRPFSTTCRTASTANSSRPSARPATRARWSARPGRRRRACRTTTTCNRITWSATSTGTTTSAAH